MLNLLRMNLYRLLHTKCMCVLLILIIMMGVFSSYMETVDIEKNGEATVESNETSADFMSGFSDGVSMEDEEESSVIELEFGIYVDSPMMENGKPAPLLKHIMADLASGVTLIFITIATVLFVNGEDKSGFVKNIAGQTKHKCNIYISKLLVLILYTLVALILYGFVQCMVLLIYYKGNIAFGMNLLGEALGLVGIHILLYVAFISGLIMLTSICRNTTMGITLGILASCGFSQLIYSGINIIFNIDLSKYSVVTNINSIAFDAGSKVIICAVVIGIVFNILYNVLGTMWFTKRDVV